MDRDWRTGPGETMEHLSAHATDLAALRLALLASESRFQGVIAERRWNSGDRAQRHYSIRQPRRDPAAAPAPG